MSEPITADWRVDGSTLYYGDGAEWVGLHNATLAAHIAAAHNDAMAALRRRRELTGPIAEVAAELARAREQHAPLNSAHEAYAVILEELDEFKAEASAPGSAGRTFVAVILEELDEFKAEVWKKTRERDAAHMREELIQLAAMALRTVEDLGI